MNEIEAASANPWKWRDNSGRFHDPAAMETRHLFYTLRMIWNHTMPEDVQVHPYQRYQFGLFYTSQYMQQAITQIGRELLKRSDLHPKWQADLAHMAKHFAKSPAVAREGAKEMNMNDMTVVTQSSSIMDEVISKGNLANLSPDQRAMYYSEVCRSIGLNPLTRPFEYINLSGKLTLYARKDCTDQLRQIHQLDLSFVSKETIDGVFIVTARAVKKDGRKDEDIGAVPIKGLQGEPLANALMKAHTKAKRRVTLSACGLGFLDESELESIPMAEIGQPQQPAPAPATIPQDLIDELNACTTVDACRVWLPGARQKLKVKPKDALYQKLIDEGKRRADEILAAAQPAPQPEPEPAPEPDAGEVELEADYHELEVES